MNQGIHGLDLLLYLFGRVKRLSAVTKTASRNMEAEDTAAVLLEFENGVVCTVSASSCAYPGHPEGDRERKERIRFLSGLSNRKYNVLRQSFLNAGPGAPECFVAQKLR